MASATIAVHVVEDHDAALPLIYRAIGAKRLPFSGLGLIHFDSHPDLLSPNIHADECTDKEKLFAFTSIAEWILPAVYMGHITCVVWVKPPWGLQMAEGTHTLHVGKDPTTGHIRVGTPLPYYISELLYVPPSELQNVRSIPLHVTTLHPLTLPQTDSIASTGGGITEDLGATGGYQGPTGEPPVTIQSGIKRSMCDGDMETHYKDGLASKTLLPPSKKQKSDGPSSSASSSKHSCSESDHQISPPPAFQGPLNPPSKPAPVKPVSGAEECLEDCSQQLCVAINSSSSWILDIDLDFFSTGNPFKSIFTEEQFKCLQELYQLEEPESPQCTNVHQCVEKRRVQLDSLRKMWSENGASIGQDTTGDIRGEVVREIQGLVGTEQEGAILEAEDLHLAGMMTDLPEHVSSEEEISGLVVALHRLLSLVTRNNIAPPSMITIARSSEDGYTPSSEVDSIQDLVMAILKQEYGRLCERLHYLDGYAVYDSQEEPCTS